MYFLASDWLVATDYAGFVIFELIQDWMPQLHTEMEQDRLVGWHLGARP